MPRIKTGWVSPKAKKEKYRIPAKARPQHVIKSEMSGKSWNASTEGLKTLRGLIQLYDLPFKVENEGGGTSGSTLYIKPTGLILNVQEKRQHQAKLTELRQLRRSLAAKTAALPERPRLATIHPDSVRNFIDGVGKWNEVCEVAHPGGELARVPTKMPLLNGDMLGVRFWPVRYTKNVGGRLYHAMTPPVAFRIHPQEVRGTFDGHPHVYDSHKLCWGTGEGNYAVISQNPFQVVPMLREWYMSLDPRSLADQNWITHSKQWWQRHGKDFFREFGDASRVINAPWAGGEKSSTVALTEGDVEAWCGSPTKNWYKRPGVVDGGGVARGSALTLAKQHELFHVEMYADRDHDCEEAGCGQVAQLVVEFDMSGKRWVCCHHAVQLPGFEGPRGHAGIAYRERLLATDAIDDLKCEMPTCGFIGCQEHKPIDTQQSAAYQFTATNPNDGAALHLAVCNDHARYLRDFYHTNFDGSMPTWSDGRDGNPHGYQYDDAPVESLFPEVLAGLHGAGYGLLDRNVQAKFGKLEQGWDTVCKVCGEIYEAHWGTTCRVQAPYDLAAGSPHSNLQDVPVWSAFDFATGKVEIPKGASKSFIEVERRMKEEDGKAIPDRANWVRDTLRKFGAALQSDTLCVDCGRKWAGDDAHVGPDCSTARRVVE